jgi:hypothetical protein
MMKHFAGTKWPSIALNERRSLAPSLNRKMKRNPDYLNRLAFMPGRFPVPLTQGRCESGLALRFSAYSPLRLGSVFRLGRRRRDGKQGLHRRQEFADRLGGPSGAGVAVVPARRIGISVWRTDFWRKPLINL